MQPIEKKSTREIFQLSVIAYQRGSDGKNSLVTLNLVSKTFWFSRGKFGTLIKFYSYESLKELLRHSYNSR